MKTVEKVALEDDQKTGRKFLILNPHVPVTGPVVHTSKHVASACSEQ